jgi:hypothetical protein
MDIFPVLRRAILGRLDWRGISRVILAGNIDKVEGLRKLYVSVILPQMNPCSEDNRTWTSQIPQRAYRRLEGFDEAFESELPPEIRRELEKPLPPINRWPARIPETEEEITAAIAWLESQGYLRPTAPAAVRPLPTRPPVVQAPKPAPPKRSSRSGGWGIVWMVIGGVFLWALLHNQSSQPSPLRAGFNPLRLVPEARQTPIDVRRALPVVPRAELVGGPAFSVPQTGQWHSVTLLDGRTVVQACYQGALNSPADLPAQGRFLGEEWSTGTGSSANQWIWLQPAGAHFASWVDP